MVVLVAVCGNTAWVTKQLNNVQPAEAVSWYCCMKIISLVPGIGRGRYDNRYTETDRLIGSRQPKMTYNACSSPAEYGHINNTQPPPYNVGNCNAPPPPYSTGPLQQPV